MPESEALEEGCRKARPWRKGAGKRGSECGLAVARDWTRMVLGLIPRVTWALDNCNQERKKSSFFV